MCLEIFLSNVKDLMKDTGSRDNVRIMRGIGGGAVQTLVSICVSIIQIRLVVEFLPRDLAGVWFLFLSIGAYFAFFDLGVGPTLSREIGFCVGRAGADKDTSPEIADIIATCSMLFRFIAAAVFTVACLAGLLFVKKLSSPAEAGRILAAWTVFSAGAALNILGGTAFSALYGMGHVGTERLNRAVFQVLGLGLAFVALKCGYGIIGLAAAWAVQNLFARMSAWRLLRRYHPGLKGLKGRPDSAIARRIVVPSLQWAGMNLGALLILNSDNVLIAALIGSAAIPPYEAPAKVITAIMLLSLLNISSSVPFLSKAHAAGNREVFLSLFFRNLRFGMGLIILFSSFFAVFGERVINAWLGAGNFTGFSVIWILTAVLILEVHHTIHATVAMSAGHIIFLKAALLAGLLKIAASSWLAGSLGIAGVALGTLAAQLLTNNWYAPYITLKTFGIPGGKYFKEIVVPLVAFLAIALAVDAVLLFLTKGLTNLPALSISLPVSLALGAAAFLAIVAPEQDRKALSELLRGTYARS